MKLFGVPFPVILGIGVALALIGAALFFDHSGHERGVSEEKARWEASLRRGEQSTARAEIHLNQDVAQRAEQAHVRTVERVRYVTQARQDIASAADTQTRYAAYLALRDRLRNDAAVYLDRAEADYVSSLAA